MGSRPRPRPALPREFLECFEVKPVWRENKTPKLGTPTWRRRWQVFFNNEFVDEFPVQQKALDFIREKAEDDELH